MGCVGALYLAGRLLFFAGAAAAFSSTRRPLRCIHHSSETTHDKFPRTSFLIYATGQVLKNDTDGSSTVVERKGAHAADGVHQVEFECCGHTTLSHCCGSHLGELDWAKVVARLGPIVAADGTVTAEVILTVRPSDSTLQPTPAPRHVRRCMERSAAGQASSTVPSTVVHASPSRNAVFAGPAIEKRLTHLRKEWVQVCSGHTVAHAFILPTV